MYRGKDGNSKKIAVRQLSLSMARGQCFGVLGPNGAGKTTLINMVSMNVIDVIIYYRAIIVKICNMGHSLISLYIMKALSILHVRTGQNSATGGVVCKSCPAQGNMTISKVQSYISLHQ